MRSMTCFCWANGENSSETAFSISEESICWSCCFLLNMWKKTWKILSKIHSYISHLFDFNRMICRTILFILHGTIIIFTKCLNATAKYAKQRSHTRVCCVYYNFFHHILLPSQNILSHFNTQKRNVYGLNWRTEIQ